jgi:hypothetical protein
MSHMLHVFTMPHMSHVVTSTCNQHISGYLVEMVRLKQMFWCAHGNGQTLGASQVTCRESEGICMHMYVYLCVVPCVCVLVSAYICIHKYIRIERMREPALMQKCVVDWLERTARDLATETPKDGDMSTCT